PTDYEVYYGCDSKCMASSVNGTVRHIINLAAVNAPQLNVTGTTNITCFNNFGRNTWTITNTGGETMTNIEFDITTSDPNGYLNPNTIEVEGASVTPTTTPGAEPKEVTITLPDLAPGASIELTFDQYYGAPSDTDCSTAPTQFRYGQNGYGVRYNYEGACAPANGGGIVTPEAGYNYSGLHLSELEMYSGSNNEFEYLFQNFNIPHTGLNVGDLFDVIIELAPGLTADAADIVLDGVTAVADPAGQNNK